ncbi:hypothetical protein G7054_g11120 [Neopestalotiopsis clavispora]|nr:hypothetical protein G7054_g11120 [Neopestalotiopsis clavispora]
MSFVTVAAASLPSVPLDFGGNRDRILESIRIAKEKGARLRTGPELEIPGYGCLDHHLEGWQVLAEIISNSVCKDMLIDLGLGVRHRNVRYNCRVLCTYRKVFFIRPKQSLANDGLYREMRYFTAWMKPQIVEDYYLEKVIRDVTGQKKVPIGDAILSTDDTAVGCETCEELFTPRCVLDTQISLCSTSSRQQKLTIYRNPSTYMGLNGAEIILNSSASHAELRKLRTRLDLISNSTRKLGGVYCYSNASGVDGEARMMYDASSMILINGKVMAQSSQFTLRPVDVITATIDIEEIRSFRSGISRNFQAAAQPDFPRVECDLRLSCPAGDFYLSDLKPSRQIDLKILNPMEELYMAEAVYLWQYLTRTNAGGFFLALSGGLDSCTVATLVFGMAQLVLVSINAGERTVLDDLRCITGEPNFTPKAPQEIVGRLLHTCYMGTKNSSVDTRSRARKLAEKIGSYHSDTNIDQTVDAMESVVDQALNFKPKFQVEGGSVAENLAKQNIQARNRMLLRGYLTKYDASSGDLAPLGSISKNDAKSFLAWSSAKWDLPVLEEFLDATPTAELLPLSAGIQSDEEEMGLSYDQLSAFGKLRKVDKLGPWSAYLRLLGDWKELPPRETAEITKRFFRFYAMNRHKAVVITPSLHLSP